MITPQIGTGIVNMGVPSIVNMGSFPFAILDKRTKIIKLSLISLLSLSLSISIDVMIGILLISLSYNILILSLSLPIDVMIGI